jgi:hypothetical protein
LLLGTVFDEIHLENIAHVAGFVPFPGGNTDANANARTDCGNLEEKCSSQEVIWIEMLTSDNLDFKP